MDMKASKSIRAKGHQSALAGGLFRRMRIAGDPGTVNRTISVSTADGQLRWLGFAADKHMLPSVRAFAKAHKDLFAKFTVCGTAVTVKAIQGAVGKKMVSVGAICSDAEVGGLTQLATLVVHKQVGAIFTFPDSLKMASQHADDLALHRLINVHNVPHATNPATAEMLASVLLKVDLVGARDLVPWLTAKVPDVSPAVAEYNQRQNAVIASLKEGSVAAKPATELPPLPQEKEVSFADVGQQLSAASVMPKRSETAAITLTGRCLALISHNHMKPAMKGFVKANASLLLGFRLTGTNSTITMLREVLGEEASFGPSCSSGPLGGDAEVVAQLHDEDIGGVIFFTDPLDAHPHASDIEMTLRSVNLYNVMHAPNPATASALVVALKEAMAKKEEAALPTFFETGISPAAEQYMKANRRKHTKTVVLVLVTVTVVIYCSVMAGLAIFQ